MKNSNTIEYKKQVQQFIVNSFDSFDNFKQTFSNCHYRRSNFQTAIYMVQGGCFDCYYNDVADRLAEWNSTTNGRIWEHFKDDTEKLWDYYCHILAMNICNLIDNKRVYIEL